MVSDSVSQHRRIGNDRATSLYLPLSFPYRTCPFPPAIRSHADRTKQRGAWFHWGAWS